MRWQHGMWTLQEVSCHDGCRKWGGPGTAQGAHARWECDNEQELATTTRSDTMNRHIEQVATDAWDFSHWRLGAA